MKRRESKNLLVTSFFLLALMALIGAGLQPGSPEAEETVVPDLDGYVPEAQFMQYLEYRARLEDGRIDCE